MDQSNFDNSQGYQVQVQSIGHLGDRRYESFVPIEITSKDYQIQAQSIGHLGDRRYELYTLQEIVVSGIGEHPPRYGDYWVARPAYEALLRDHLDQQPVTEIVAAGGFGKSSLAAWGFDRLKEGFERRVWVSFRQPHFFDRFARYVLQEIDRPVKDPLATEESLLRELVLRLNDANRPIRLLVVMDQLDAALSHQDWDWYVQFLQCWAEQGQGSAVLVTTRTPILEQMPIELGGFSVSEGAVFLGEQCRLTQEGKGFAELVALAAGHPLLLNLAAAWVRQTYGARVDEPSISFFRKLFEQYQGDPTAKVEDIFETLFGALPEGWQDLLLRVSVYRLPFDLEMAQAMGDTLLELQRDMETQHGIALGNLADSVMEQSLQALVERGLLSAEGDHFTLHPLVATLVQEKLRNSSLESGSHKRAIAYYEAHAQEWDGTIESCQETLEAFYHACELANYAQADRILRRCSHPLQLAGHWRVLLPLYERLTQEWQWTDEWEATQLAGVLNSLGALHSGRGDYSQALFAYQKALELKRLIGDRFSEALSLENLGSAYCSSCQYPLAIKSYQEALSIAREIDAPARIANALEGLGNVYKAIGQYQRALELYQQQYDLAREIGDRQGEANSLGNSGNVYHSLKEYQQAIELHQQSLAIKREIGDRQGEANSLANVGDVYNSLKEYQRAIDFYQQALEVRHEIGDRHIELNILEALGTNHRNLGKYQQEIEVLQQRCNIAREIGDRQSEANSLGDLGIACYNLREYQQVIEFYQQWHDIACEIGDQRGEANSLENSGAAYHALGEYQRAIELYQQSLSIRQDIGDRIGEANSLCSLATIYQQRGQLKRAMQYRHLAYRIWQELQLPVAAVPIPNITKRMFSSMDNGEWVDTLVQSEKQLAWLFLPIGYFLFTIRLLLSPLSKIQTRLKIPLLYFWFGIGLAIVLLLWWLRK